VNSVSFWRYVAVGALSCIVGIFGGSYNPNRNLATRDDISTMDAKISAQSEKIDSMEKEIYLMRGQLQAQKLLAQ
jgi:cell division protein FtsL